VRFTKAVSYGLVALTRLERESDGGPITAKELARMTGLPANYLTTILMKLANARILQSNRGVQRGFSLVDRKISVGMVIEALEGPLAGIRCTTGHASEEDRIRWFLEERLAETFSGILIGDLVD